MTLKNIIETLKSIYSRPFYIILNIIFAFVYYLIFTFLVEYQNYGILLIESPVYLLYLLIMLSSILLTISIYSIRNTKKNIAKVSGTTVSAIAVLFGGVVGGCGCAAPIIYGISVLGLGLGTTSTVAYYLNSYIIEIFIFIILLTLFMILYYLNKLSSKNCVVRRQGKKTQK
ncbi:MAG: hypothetical protein ACP5M9_03955 [Candidatus Micrarchaeia archaeon]